MPAAAETTTAAARKTTSAAPRGTATRTTTRATRTANGTHSASTFTTTPTITATPTPSPEPAGGPSGAMIGGIAGGVVAVLALVGLVFYKRRQRASVAAATTSTSGKGSRDMMEVGAGIGAGASSQKAISGPMALAPENGTDAGPTHRPEAQFREQQQFRPGMRDELFAKPGSALNTTPSNKSKGSNHNNHGGNNNNNNNNNMQGAGPVSREIQNVQQNNSHGVPRGQESNNNNHNENQSGGAGDYYDDPLDFYSQEPESIGAQRSAPQPRDLQHGNLTPAPEYYLGKEDIDPRRDLRGLDNPDTYTGMNRKDSDYPHDPRQPVGGAPLKSGGMTKEPLSPRSSYSSDGEAYLTIEQAQDAHNRKIQGHKESIGSVQMLIEHSSARSPTSTKQDPMHSAAISDSTVSMMPSLPSVASPMSFTPHNNNRSQTSLPRSNGSPPNGGSGGSNRPAAPPSAPGMREDPYAESAYSEDYYDNQSLVSGGYNRSPAGGPQYNNGPENRQHPQTPPPLRIQHNNGPYPASPGSRGSPYSPQVMSPPYHPNQGYNNNNNGPRNQYPDSAPYGGGRPSPTSHGYSSPSPGFGPSQHPPYNGGHHGNPGPGYRPHPPQRDPSYNTNQGPYRGPY